MDTIKATVRGGRLELDEPLNLPDGTEVFIPMPNGTAQGPYSADEETPETPGEIEAWLNWYDSLQPNTLTDDVMAAIEDRRRAEKEWIAAHGDEYFKRLEGMWK